MELVWSPLVRTRLREIRAFVALDKPEAAERLVIRIVAMTEVLRRFPFAGRAGAQPGLRELPVGGTPYILVYSVRGNEVVIGTIRHGAQSHPL